MKDTYITITGCRYFYGTEFFEKDMEVWLEKEPDNKYDSEAIKVMLKGLGQVGHVANSPYTVKGESMSAGRIYDKIGDIAKAKVLFILPDAVICQIIDKSKERNKKRRNNHSNRH